ncbi:flagellar hook-associated protein FlgK [Ramlibacter sp. 2FC]|uniref:flagellar hook-associated protein FlgK n=1 Tax=Ramlibacter sp. 2FC TaxID=2502188 RepID=UPI0010F8106E|nr:flagellar hook-associated protein FlgK [Ramlibacter sp. 2FC]
MGGLISLGTRTMFAAQAQLNTTAANIANANTPGYSRQSVQLETAGGQYSGAGFFGKGVNITTVSRAHNAFLSTEVATTRAAASADQARLGYLQRLEQVFDMGEAGLGHAAGQLLNAFADVASEPADASARQVVLSRAEMLASRFRAAAGEIDSLQASVTQDLKTSVDAANALARRIADLNQQIARVKGLGHEPNDLLDQREQLIAELSDHVQVAQIPADDGSVGLFIAGGQRLVLGNSALELVATPDPYDQTVLRLGLREAGVDRLISESTLAGGDIAGLLNFQNQDLRSSANQIGRMAAALAQSLNAQQQLGLDQDGNTGAALLQTGLPRVLPATGAGGNAGTAQLGAVISDASALTASDYEIKFDGANYSMTRLGDGAALGSFSPAQLGAGVSLDGLALSLQSGAAQAGDSFLVQPVRLAAASMARTTSDPRDLAAASRVRVEAGAGNTGTLAVAALRVGADTPELENTVTLSFTGINADGNYNFSVAGTVTGTVPTLVAPGGTISINGWELQINGRPQAGDTLEIRSNRDGKTLATDNGNALGLLALRDQALVAGETLTDAYASTLASVGVRVQSADASASMSQAIAADAKASRDNLSGVNLDEEAARLIQFQQSYQAAAKVLQIAQTVFDTLLQAAGR